MKKYIFKRILMTSFAVAGASAALIGLLSTVAKTNSSTVIPQLTNNLLSNPKANFNSGYKHLTSSTAYYPPFFAKATNLPTSAKLNDGGYHTDTITGITKIVKSKNGTYFALFQSNSAHSVHYLFSSNGDGSFKTQVEFGDGSSYSVNNMVLSNTGNVYIQNVFNKIFKYNSKKATFDAVDNVNSSNTFAISEVIDSEDSKSFYFTKSNDNDLYYYNSSTKKSGISSKDYPSVYNHDTSSSQLVSIDQSDEVLLIKQGDGINNSIYKLNLDYGNYGSQNEIAPTPITGSTFSSGETMTTHLTTSINGTQVTYIGTDEGNIYAISNGKCTKSSIDTNLKINTIYQSNGLLYVGTNKGLFVSYSSISQKLSFIKQALNNKKNIAINKITVVQGDKQNIVYVATDDGLYYASNPTPYISSYTKYSDIKESNIVDIFVNNNQQTYVTSKDSSSYYSVYCNSNPGVISFSKINDVTYINGNNKAPYLFNISNNKTYITTFPGKRWSQQYKVVTYGSADFVKDIIDLQGAATINGSIDKNTLIIKKTPGQNVTIKPSKEFIQSYTVDGVTPYNPGEIYTIIPDKKTSISFTFNSDGKNNSQTINETFWVKTKIVNDDVVSSDSLITGYKSLGQTNSKIAPNKDVYVVTSPAKINTAEQALSVSQSYYTKLDAKTMAEGSKINFKSVTTLPASGIFHIYVTDIFGQKNDFYLEAGSDNLKIQLTNNQISAMQPAMTDMKISLYQAVSSDKQKAQATELQSFITSYQKQLKDKINSYLNITEYKKILKGYSPSSTFKASAKLSSGLNYLSPTSWTSGMSAQTQFKTTFNNTSYVKELHDELYADFAAHHGGATPDNYNPNHPNNPTSKNTNSDLYYLLILLALIPIIGLIVFFIVRSQKKNKHQTMSRRHTPMIDGN